MDAIPGSLLSPHLTIGDQALHVMRVKLERMGVVVIVFFPFCTGHRDATDSVTKIVRRYSSLWFVLL